MQTAKIAPARGRRPRLVVWEVADGYGWTLKASNGNTLADSGEAYTRESDAYAAAVRVVALLRGALVLDRQATRQRVWVSIGAGWSCKMSCRITVCTRASKSVRTKARESLSQGSGFSALQIRSSGSTVETAEVCSEASGCANRVS